MLNIGISFIVVFFAITLIVSLPTLLVRNRYKKFRKCLSPNLTLETVMQTPTLHIKEMVNEAAHESQTSKVLDQAYNSFLDKFIDSYLEQVNASDADPRKKAKELTVFKQHIDIGLDTPALEKITTAKDKLEGNVSV